MGGTLEAYVERTKRLSHAVSIDILIDVAKGLKNLHAAGIMHRDIKPENICLHQEHSRLRAYVIDMGGSVDIPEVGTKIGIAGTVGPYLAPELRNKDGSKGCCYDEKVDLH